ncbi:MAG: ATP-binding protein [Muribaculaceae bacterium]
MRFKDVIGNEAAIARLRAMADAERIPHALLLMGEPCVPKLALALAFAQYVHCENRVNGDSCGVCPSCLQHQSHNHVDTFFSYPILKKKSGGVTLCSDYSKEWQTFLLESTVENYERWLALIKNENGQPIIYGDESDEIVRKMSLSSYSARYKIHIMWLPEKMNGTCANSLLKMLEEPYADSLFVLVSNRYQDVLPTIYSRTQRVLLKKPSTQLVANYLVDKYGLDEQDALAYAAPADGNIVLAEQSLQQGNENQLFHEKFTQLMRMAYSVDLKGLRDWSVEVNDFRREKICRFMEYASRMVRENYIYNLRHRELNYLTREEEQFSTRFSPFINELNVEGIIEEFNKARIDVHGNANGKIVLFDLAIKMTILIKKKR